MMKDRVEGRPHGITYLTTGGVREDILEIAEFIDGVRSGSGAAMSDEEFRASVLSRLEGIEEKVEELYGGMNFLGDILRKAKLLG